MTNTNPVVDTRDVESVLFGMFMPQGWKMELASIDGAAAKWQTAVDIAVRIEELGYDSLWVYDHFHNVPKPAHEAVFECWTTMAAISQRTSRIRLGQMVGCNSYREPSVLAKITSTIDVISGGRLDWGIGAGWYENEYKGYGFEFRRPRDRIGMLRETVQIVRSMWTEPETSFDGEYYKLSRAQCDPKPLQSPHPPDLGGRRRRADHAAGRCPLRRLRQLRWQARRVGAQARDPEGALRSGRSRRGHHPQDLDARGVHP
jgi:alkanesulfonate monooxygenase SsuD/methylene tetrahydromethanopterin reductase-like flavin-dependent oxidoreductase (luciferase family)